MEPLPIGGDRAMHWSQAKLEKRLVADPDATITSMRVDLPRFDVRGRLVHVQLQSQTSTDTLADVLRRWPDAVLVAGLFDNEGDPRTIDEVERDLERCTGRRSGPARAPCGGAHDERRGGEADRGVGAARF